MKFEYKGSQYEYPATLDQVTLQQRIDFHNLYGRTFDENLLRIAEIEDLTEREIQLTELKVLFAVQSFSFFTGLSLDVIQAEFELSQVMNVYNTSLTMMLDEEAQLKPQDSYLFNDEEWVIAPPIVSPQSKFTFNEFLTSKEIVRQLEQVGQKKWEALLHLCCIYLRKPGEAFNEDFVDPDGERLELMRKLPMNIALQVGFFLTVSMTSFMQLLQSSSVVAQAKEQT